MLGMSDPSADAGSDIVETYRSRLPPVAQAAQAIAGAANIVLGEAATTVGMQFEAEELRGLAARQDHGFARVKLQSSTHEITLDPQSPLGQYSGVIIEQREVVDVAQVRRPQHLGHKVIETIEIKVGEELAGQVTDRQAAAALEWHKEVVAVEIEVDRLLRVGGIDDQVEQRQR